MRRNNAYGFDLHAGAAAAATESPYNTCEVHSMKARLLTALVSCCSCSSPHLATERECVEIVNQIVALELRQAGFRDALLEKLRANELHKALGPELSSCRRLTLTDDVLDHVGRATWCTRSQSALWHGAVDIGTYEAPNTFVASKFIRDSDR
jgi:hypothetical protein